MMNEPRPMIIIPSTPNIVERQSIKTTDPNLNVTSTKITENQIRKTLKINPASKSDLYAKSFVPDNYRVTLPKPNPPKIDPQDITAAPRYRVIHTINEINDLIYIPENAIQMRQSLLPLHYFDDESYDFNKKYEYYIQNLPQKAECLYSYDGETLKWRNCDVLEYNPPFFKILWEGSSQTKYVYRISLRFPFELPVRHEERRQFAFEWREIIEKEIKLFTELKMKSNFSKNDVPPPSSEIIHGIIEKIEKEYHVMPKFQELLQDMIEYYYFSDVLYHYAEDCKDPHKLNSFLNNGLVPFKYYVTNNIYLKKLHYHQIHCLNLPNYKNMQLINEKLIRITEMRLFDINYPNKTFNVVKYSNFFDQQNMFLTKKYEEINDLIYNFVLNQVKELIKECPPALFNNLIKMIDLRIASILESIVQNSLDEFMDKIKENQIFFKLSTSEQLIVENPTEETLNEKGINFIEKIYLCFYNSLPSMKLVIFPCKISHIAVSLDRLRTFYIQCKDKWRKLSQESYNLCKSELNSLRKLFKDIPLNPIKSINDIIDINSNNMLDINLLHSSLQKASSNLQNVFNLYDSIIFGFIYVDFTTVKIFIKNHCTNLKEIACKFISQKIIEITDSIQNQIQDLKFQSQRIPETIDEWFTRHNLILDLKSNFYEIDENLSYAYSLFNFLDDFFYDSYISISFTYQLKQELYEMWSMMPNLLKQDDDHKNRLTILLQQSENELQEKIYLLYKSVSAYHIKNDLNCISFYRKELSSLENKFLELSKCIDILQNHDKIVQIPVKEYDFIYDVKKNLNIFIPFWDIVENLDMKVEFWMSRHFLELNSDVIVETIKKWGNSLKEAKVIFENMGDFVIDNVEIKKGQHPLIKIWETYQEKMSILVGHVPIIQHLCNPHLRNRHWLLISKISQLEINPSAGLTWHWIIESSLEEHILEITNISISANYEFKIEKALNEMIEQIRILSLDVTKENNRSRINNTAPILSILSEHQKRIQELFIPPYIKPFLMKIKEYNELSVNLRLIIKMTLNAQSQIDDLAPTMESQDIRTQSRHLTAKYDENLKMFNRFVDKFGNPSQFHELITNPKFINTIEDLHGNLSTVKKGLNEILREKRRLFPYFRLLSDSQLIYLLSYSHVPSKIKHLFHYIYPKIAEATFDKNEKRCIGFISTDNEFLKFNFSFEITPESIETIFENFDNAMISTMRAKILNISRKQILNISKVVNNNPSQIVVASYQVIFNQKMMKVFESKEKIFSSNKSSFLNQQFKIIQDNIQTEIYYLGDLAKKGPVSNILNLVTILIKQRDIVETVIKNKITENESYQWKRYIRYIGEGDREDNFTIQVSCGPSSFDYGFVYLGRDPIMYPIKSIENMYAVMTSTLSQCSNILVYGHISSYKTAILKSYAQVTGKNYIIYSCSSTNTAETLTNLVHTASMTGAFLILREIGLVNNLTFSDFAPLINPFLKKKDRNYVNILATFSLKQKCQSLPPHLKFFFRPINYCHFEDKGSQILKTFIYGIGLNTNHDLYQQLSMVLNSSIITENQYYASKFNIQNIMSSIVKTPLVSKISSQAVYQILLSQINDSSDDCKTLKQEINCIFNDVKSESIKYLPKTSNDINHTLIKDFLNMLESTDHIIVIGDDGVGKSSLIKECARIKAVNISYINPYAQPLSYLSGGKSNGVLYNYISNQLDEYNWIVFDSKCSDHWLNILGISMSDTSSVYFSDGSSIKHGQKIRFIFETDSLEETTPSLLSYCSRLYIPNTSFSYTIPMNSFIDKPLSNDRIIEPLSETIIGTKISKESFQQKIEIILNELIPMSIKSIEIGNSCILTIRHTISNFFRILEAFLSVHYYNEMNVSGYAQQSLPCMIDDFPNYAIFAAIWSFGCSVQYRQKFDSEFRKRISELPFHSPNSIKFTGNVFDVYFDAKSRTWKTWDFLSLEPFYNNRNEITDATIESILIPNKTLLPSLYISNCILSQCRSILINGNKDINKILMILGINTSYISSHFSELCFLTPKEKKQKILRKMIEQCISPIKDLEKSTMRVPLLSFIDLDITWNKMTEFLRYVTEHKNLVNLHTFSNDPVMGLTFIGNIDLSQTSFEKVDKRLLGHYVILQFHDNDDSQIMFQSISNAIQTLYSVQHSDLVSKILLAFIKNMNGIISTDQKHNKFHFNMKHIFSLIQRVVMDMEGQSLDFFPTALGYESIISFYDSTRNENILTSLNKMMTDIGIGLHHHCISLDEIVDKFTLSSFEPNVYKSVISLNQTNTNSFKISTHIKSYNQYFDNASCRKNYIHDLSHFSITHQQHILLQIIHLLMMANTHILLNCDFSFISEKLIIESSKILSLPFTTFEPGDNLLKTIHDVFIAAGKNESHQVLIIDENKLSPKNTKILKSIVKSTNVYGLFEKNEILDLMSEIHCTMANEDPYHEETLESKPNYHLLVRDFMRNCNHYFHLCILSDGKSSSFYYYSKYIAPINIVWDSNIILNNLMINDIINIPFSDKTRKLIDVIIQKLYYVPFYENKSPFLILSNLSCIHKIFSLLLEKSVNKYEEQYSILSHISNVVKMTEKELENTLKHQEIMKNEAQTIGNEIEKLMEETESAAQKAKLHKEMLENEKQVLHAQQLQAENLRQESEDQLAKTKLILQASTSELRNLSSGDISVIKSMNHPPKGVFLVVKSIVVIFGHKIEDKNDEPSALQQSWILGKKLLSDPSFLSNLMKRSLDSVTENIVNSLTPIIDDPNFQPSIVENSSTAAKSICKFIRAIIPYYNAMKLFDMKQNELKSCQEILIKLQKQYDETNNKAIEADFNINELKHKMNILQQQKQEIETKINEQQSNINDNNNTMSLINTFFNEWDNEMKDMSEQKETSEIQTFFLASCLTLFSISSINDREKIFQSIYSILKEVLSGNNQEILESLIQNRNELANFLLKSFDISFQRNKFLIDLPINFVENYSLLQVFNNEWLFVIDTDKTINSLLKPLFQKKFTITSYKSSLFKSDLYFALLGNDILIIYDYDYALMDPIFFQIEKRKRISNTLKVKTYQKNNNENNNVMFVDGKQVSVKYDFLIIFVVDKFPETNLFNSIFIDLHLNDEEINNKISESIFLGIEPEKSHQTLSAIKSINNSKKELEETKNNLQEIILNSSSSLLNDNNTIKQFQIAHCKITRLEANIQKRTDEYHNLFIEFEKIKIHSIPFIEIYKKSEISDGIDHFYNLVNQVIDGIIHTFPESCINNSLSDRIYQILHYVRTRIAITAGYSKDFISKINFLLNYSPNLGNNKNLIENLTKNEFEHFINQITETYNDQNILSHPLTISEIMKETNNKIPIIIKASYKLYNHFTSDKIILGKISTIVDDYNQAIHDGKILAVFLPSYKLFPFILSVIANMKNAISLSQDFRFFIFTDAFPIKRLTSKSVFFEFCQFINMSGLLNIRRNMILTISSIHFAIFETKISNHFNISKRVLILLAFFDSAANLLSQMIFKGHLFNEENIVLMIQYCAKIPLHDVPLLGEMFVNTLYGTEQPNLIDDLMNIWTKIFTMDNLTNGQIIMFDCYRIPLVFSHENLLDIPKSFPLIDSPSIFTSPVVIIEYQHKIIAKIQNQIKQIPTISFKM